MLRAVLLAPFVVAAVSPSARADESAYCEKVRARAKSDAALMFGPSVQVQGIHFPRIGAADLTQVGQGWQLRGGLSTSPVDIYKGTVLLDVAEADCKRAEAHDVLLEFVVSGTERVRVSALRRELELLDGSEKDAQAFLAKAQQRFEARAITLSELHEVMALHSDFERKRITLRGEIGRAEAGREESASKKPTESNRLAKATASLEASTMRLENELVRMRALDAWKIFLRGGVVAERPFDYYAILELSYNLGQVAHSARDRDYLRARSRELKEGPAELTEQAKRLQSQLRVTRTQIEGERGIVEDQLRVLRETRVVVERSEAPTAPHQLALVGLQEIMLNAEAAYLTTFAEELAKL